MHANFAGISIASEKNRDGEAVCTQVMSLVREHITCAPL